MTTIESGKKLIEASHVQLGLSLNKDFFIVLNGCEVTEILGFITPERMALLTPEETLVLAKMNLTPKQEGSEVQLQSSLSVNINSSLRYKDGAEEKITMSSEQIQFLQAISGLFS